MNKSQLQDVQVLENLTLLGILATLDQASGGELIVCGESISKLNEEQRAAGAFKAYWLCVSVLSTAAHLTAVENVMLRYGFMHHLTLSEAEQRALSLLQKLD